MKLNRSVEHGVLVLLMLALQEGHAPVTGEVLAERLGVSESYLRKTLRKLVVAGLVESSASRGGGFCLARGIDRISLADAYEALDPEGFAFRASPLARAVFPDAAHAEQGMGAIDADFAEAYGAFLDSLATHPLSELLKDGAWQEGAVDWAQGA